MGKKPNEKLITRPLIRIFLRISFYSPNLPQSQFVGSPDHFLHDFKRGENSKLNLCVLRKILREEREKNIVPTTIYALIFKRVNVRDYCTIN